mmetsp:Transcript_2954/g.6044  ORF Transcript_2954/g.6044 Transcript_2954/m.6044 type:complete len:255 (+) Transcript_2954:80-844(+)
MAWVLPATGVDTSIKIESPDFESLFSCGEERLDRVIGSSDSQLLSRLEALGLSQNQLIKKLGFLDTYSALEQRDVLRARPLPKVGCSLQLAQKQTGEVFVSQVTMFTVESTSGEVYIASIHDDATSACSVSRLLHIAGTGEYFVLLRALHNQLCSGEVAERVQRLKALLHNLLRKDLLRKDLLSKDLREEDLLKEEDLLREEDLLTEDLLAEDLLTEELEGVCEGSLAKISLPCSRRLSGQASALAQASKDPLP